MMRFAVFVILAVTFVHADPSKFEEHEVVPDVIDEAPAGVCNVEYESGVKCEFGNVLTPTQVQKQPKITWDHEEGVFYTVIFTDPDAPSRAQPRGREFLHCIIANIPGNDLDAGLELFGFIGSGPPKGSGLHRYVYLVYKQPEKIDFTGAPVPNTSDERRAKFNTRKWTSDHGLGKPIAGNFYQAEWDDYVPTLHKQLGWL